MTVHQMKISLIQFKHLEKNWNAKGLDKKVLVMFYAYHSLKASSLHSYNNIWKALDFLKPTHTQVEINTILHTD